MFKGTTLYNGGRNETTYRKQENGDHIVSSNQFKYQQIYG